MVCWPRLWIKSFTTAPGIWVCGRKPASGRTLLSSSALRNFLVCHDLAVLDRVGPNDRDGLVEVAVGIELDVLGRAVLVVRRHVVEDVLARGLPGLEGVEE